MQKTANLQNTSDIITNITKQIWTAQQMVISNYERVAKINSIIRTKF